MAVPHLTAVALRVGLVNLAMWLIGFAVSLRVDFDTAVAFTAGVASGVLNLYLYMRIVKKGITKPLEEMAGFIISRYYGKFFIIILLLTGLIWRLKLNALPLLLGFVGTIMATIVTMVFISRKEYI